MSFASSFFLYLDVGPGIPFAVCTTTTRLSRRRLGAGGSPSCARPPHCQPRDSLLCVAIPPKVIQCNLHRKDRTPAEYDVRHVRIVQRGDAGPQPWPHCSCPEEPRAYNTPQQKEPIQAYRRLKAVVEPDERGYHACCLTLKGRHTGMHRWRKPSHTCAMPPACTWSRWSPTESPSRSASRGSGALCRGISSSQVEASSLPPWHTREGARRGPGACPRLAPPYGTLAE